MKKRSANRTGAWDGSYAFVVIAAIAACAGGSCIDAPSSGTGASPLSSAPAIEIGGGAIVVANVAAMGSVASGTTLEIHVRSETARYALVLLGEDEARSTAVIVGGAAVGEPYTFITPEPGEYFVFVVHDPTSSPSAPSAEIRVRPASSQTDHRPARQLVYVRFQEGFLTEPGLFDPTAAGEDDRAFLEAIAPTVEAEVVRRLQEIFAGVPIEITGAAPSDADRPYSTLTFSPERVLADQNDINDTALPPADPTRPECQVRVIFGELLPRGTVLDPGNRNLSDEAVVYVGSFQGRGEACWSSAVGSLGSVVQTLSQTAAHEIGHLVGLFHVEQIDLMNRSATLAFLRELEFARGQIQIDRNINGEIAAEVYPAIVQHPARYFESIFAKAAEIAP